MARFQSIIPSPIGELALIAEDDALVEIHFHGVRGDAPLAAHPILEQAARELGEYFAGRRTRFEIPLRAYGTEFQRQVWDALSAIPFGERRAYADIARSIGRPKAVRAVGAANGQNPLPIVVPCHRVVGKDGSMTGFGGGLPIKRWLLSHEHESEPLTLRSAPASPA